MTQNPTVKINLDSYLVDFVISQSGNTSQPINIYRNNYIGSLLYRLLDKIPENCRYIEPVISKKRILEIEVTSAGSRSEHRKRGYYYFPMSKQREFESAVKDLFDELFFLVVEMTKEYTDKQYIEIIEIFCNRYGIDFPKHFDALKKKHYRARLLYVKNKENNVHQCPAKMD